ncbi:synaptic vesicle glycoprotein 2C-like isoform X1 [Limulus polyphemus]|uniref:Synaptic vesicle glycoprotein 2C-like isoform X1 n=1 Tax=Limulus polyphemus TaxID=6850 RepID=A0ABM1SKK6_LIMPO|nr:synaptic vesicle glycoprotein 2C-like isoform X1 [Limulus polyphemus]XP_022244161.1 synaptic vesicle glycoprotein 2C-like isoform X1 [Limulus polyphemus]XP_022244162.1 synaptic vesicle glycoprotein 2C-like isoform X1 [Limulus polyphemus]XP_022244164.1 synaptic vesicle glycoprotein 2C-like isoform X1 [Limulus polyphemus]XP_022244165.1 synaptic vesicle glycoprotein 2C-like isoform X1 [Limulus polyphemus]
MTHIKLENLENMTLVNREALPAGSYTQEVRRQSDTEFTEMDYVDSDMSVLSQFHEDAISQAGFGRFQWIVFMILGLGLAADSIEVLVIAYILPSAERELCMEASQKGWLVGISFLGMMIGGLVWGILADKIGRRRTLLSALSANAIFALITAFMPTYGLFMLTRLCSGIGVGGSLPIVFTYYSEFLIRRHRGRHLSWLLIFWGVGGVFVALMAWAIIPRTGFTILLSEKLHFASWRIFLVICALPAVISSIGLFFLPESPRFLLEKGRDGEAMVIYQNIFKTNHAHSPGSEYQLSDMEMPTRQLFTIPLPTRRGLLAELIDALDSFWNSLMQIVCRPYTRITAVLLVVWVTTAFGFYGMSIWFPEYIKKITVDEFRARASSEVNKTIHNTVFNNTMENIHYYNTYFENVRFEDMVLSHCTFTNCTFLNCTFSDVRSSKTFFRRTEFYSAYFYDTDFHEYRFQDCNLENSHFISTTAGCTIDFDINYNLQTVFLENLFAQMAIIPGNILSSYVIDRLGRVKTMASSLFLTSLSAFFIWFLDTKASVIGFEAVFNFISISGWNALDVITTESYCATLRTTGYGFLSAISRFSAILGSLTFANFINISKAVPMLTTAIVLFTGCLIAFKLPETKDTLM